MDNATSPLSVKCACPSVVMRLTLLMVKLPAYLVTSKGSPIFSAIQKKTGRDNVEPENVRGVKRRRDKNKSKRENEIKN